MSKLQNIRLKNKMGISKREIKLVVLMIMFIYMLNSCASMSTLQTARVTEKGQYAYVFGGGVVESRIPYGTTDTLKLTIPFVEIGIRYGIFDKMDVGAKISIIGTATADVKYQFIGDSKSKFAGSIGLGVGYMNMNSNVSNTILQSNFVDAMLPVYFSYHPINWIALYCSPKYVLRTIISQNYNDNTVSYGHSNWYGASGGIRIGKRIAFLAEYTLFENNQISEPFSQITCGISYGFY
ncbi:MAG: DUF5777 family beta-barrel protein [Paludibacter sp.]|nr:DUF5777 family beta-barrel protein [Paludibacter sp.]